MTNTSSICRIGALIALLLVRTHKERALSLALAVPYTFSAYGIVVLFLNDLSG